MLQNFLNISNVAHASIEQAHMGMHKNRHTHKLTSAEGIHILVFVKMLTGMNNPVTCLENQAQNAKLLGDVILYKMLANSMVRFFNACLVWLL